MQKTIALFGASGRTGQCIVKQLLDEGFTIKALVRNPDKITYTSKNISLIKGDATSYDVVLKTIEGADAVISVLGYAKGSVEGFQSKAIENIINAMQTKQVQRIIILTGAGVYFDGDKYTLGNRLLTFLIKTIAPARFSDGVLQTKLLTQTNLDWTIVRAPFLTNGVEKKSYKTGSLILGFFNNISRNDVANFIVSVLNNNSFIHQAPQISY